MFAQIRSVASCMDPHAESSQRQMAVTSCEIEMQSIDCTVFDEF